MLHSLPTLLPLFKWVVFETARFGGSKVYLGDVPFPCNNKVIHLLGLVFYKGTGAKSSVFCYQNLPHIYLMIFFKFKTH